MAMAPSACAVTSPAHAQTAGVRPRGAGLARAVAAAKGGTAKWWAPLVGWSGKADYLEAPAPAPAVAVAQEDDVAAAVRRQFVGGLTEAKARELRARMAQTESFHDAMYHSAIASRLARSA